jgi:hypothetical protein
MVDLFYSVLTASVLWWMIVVPVLYLLNSSVKSRRKSRTPVPNVNTPVPELTQENHQSEEQVGASEEKPGNAEVEPMIGLTYPTEPIEAAEPIEPAEQTPPRGLDVNGIALAAGLNPSILEGWIQEMKRKAVRDREETTYHELLVTIEKSNRRASWMSGPPYRSTFALPATERN